MDVISTSEPVIEGPFGSLIERIIEWMDEYYSIRLSEMVKMGMTEKARRGEMQSTPSFGYRAENGMFVPVPEEATVVREIFNRFIAGDGTYPIAKWLNETGVRTHRGNRYENRTVEYILRNPVYIGKLRWNPTGRSRRNFDDPNIILANAGHEPLIDMSTWEAAQRRMAEIKAQWGYKARPTHELKDWPSGFIRCSDCGATLVYALPHYYKCNNYIRGRCRSSQHVRADLLKEAIIERLTEDAATIYPLKASIMFSKERGGSELALLESHVAQLEKKKDRLREAYLNGIDTVEEYRNWKQSADEELESVKRRIAEIKEQTSDLNYLPLLRRSIEEALKTLSAPDASNEDKNSAARSVIDTCIFDKASNTLSITYRVLF